MDRPGEFAAHGGKDPSSGLELGGMGKCVECSQDVAGGGRLTSKLLKPKLQTKPSQTEEAASFVDARLGRRALCTGLGRTPPPPSGPGCGCLAGSLPLGDGLLLSTLP